MNIVFCLSEPLDLTPALPLPVSAELLPLFCPTPFDRLTAAFADYFPDARLFVLDPGRPPFFHHYSGTLDALELPTTHSFARLFLFSAFRSAFNLSPWTLFVPANIGLPTPEDLARNLRALEKTGAARPDLVLFTDETGDNPVWCARGSALYDLETQNLTQLKAWAGPDARARFKETNPDKPFPGAPYTGIFAVNTARVPEWWPEADGQGHELFYLLEKSWKDGQGLDTVLPSIISLLEGINTSDALLASGEAMLAQLKAGSTRLQGLPAVLEKLPLDEAGNYVQGPANLHNVSRSLVLNSGTDSISISHLSGLLVSAAVGEIKISPLSSKTLFKT